MFREKREELYQKALKALMALGLDFKGGSDFGMILASSQPVGSEVIQDLFQKVIQESGFTFQVRSNTKTMLSGPIRLNGTLFATLTVSNFTASSEELLVTFAFHSVPE